MKTGRLIPLLICLSLSAGCVEDLIRSLYPVSPSDGEIPYPDGAVGFDGKIPHRLSLVAIKPEHGPFVGGTEVLINGSGFVKGAKVRIGGTTVDSGSVTLLSPVSLKVITPPGKLGKADVQVLQGGQEVRLTDGYYYDQVYLDPSSGPVAGGTLVTLHGKDTQFTKGMKLQLGGKALTAVELVSPTVLRAKTPAGPAGPAALTMATSAGDKTIADAYSFYQSANPKSGGLGGGKLKGTLTVDVLNWLTRQPLAGASVVVQKERSFTRKALTNSQGTAVFADKGLSGKVTVTAGMKGFESTSMLSFDARDLTIFLLPIPQPQPGAFPPGSLAGVIRGHLLFGDATGVGSPKWKLVPEPKLNQVKRAYVFSSVPRIAWGPSSYGGGDTIEFKASGAKAWAYTLYSRTGSLAVFALAGIYDKSNGKFQPYAMGVTRGVVVGPGDVAKADIWVTIPLTEKVTVALKQVPAEVTKYQLRLAVDLGADGLIIRPDNEVKGDGVISGWTFGRMPSFNHKGLVDASYTVDALLDTGTTAGLPMTRATERLVQPKAGVITVDQLIGVPKQVTPPPGGTLQGNTIRWAAGGLQPNLAVTVIRKTDETPVWRIYGPGTASVIKLPDPATFGLPPWPQAPVVWLQYLAYLPGFSFDNYTYSHQSSRYWSRWSHDEFKFKGK